MKYTNYLINGDAFNIDKVIPENKTLKAISTIYLIPVAGAGLVFCVGMLPIMLSIDGGRYTKANYIFYTRKFRKFKYYKLINNIVDIINPKPKIELAFKSAYNFEIISVNNYHISPKYLLINLGKAFEFEDMRNKLS